MPGRDGIAGDLFKKAWSLHHAFLLSVRGCRGTEMRYWLMKSEPDDCSIDDLAARYNVKRQTVITNLAKYVEADNALDAARLQAEERTGAEPGAEPCSAPRSALRSISDSSASPTVSW